ncbi:MAG: hypothetical protein IKX14_01615 [Neisseriaceae bacterium]|nr:hypothetical protein [Neisseriaceae bacterium]
MMKKITLCLCVALATTPALAFEWEKLFDRTHPRTGDKYSVYIDKQSYKEAKQNQSNIKQVWEKAEMTTQRRNIVTLVDIDCSNRSFRHNKSRVYDLAESKLLEERDMTTTPLGQWQGILNYQTSICR